MNKCLNLAFPEKSEIPFEVYHYPDGHQHIKLKTGFNKYSKIDIVCRITNANDLFILLQVKNVLEFNKMTIDTLTILYLFTARCDRHFSIGEALDIEIVGKLIQSLGAWNYRIYDIHSDKLKENLYYRDLYALEKFDYSKYRLCFPDQGANDRLNRPDYEHEVTIELDKIYKHCNKYKPVICGKSRDSFGSIIQSEIISKPRKANKYPILVVDDLCDGGGTFIAIAEKLRELNPPKLSIFVTHAIQFVGIEKIASVYDEVFITNSYRDWNKTLQFTHPGKSLPENVTVIEL